MHGSASSGKVWGHAPPRKFLNFRPSEIASGAFSRPFVAFKLHDEMTMFLVLIRHYRPGYTGADKALRSNCWIVTSKTP